MEIDFLISVFIMLGRFLSVVYGKEKDDIIRFVFLKRLFWLLCEGKIGGGIEKSV